MKNGLLLIAYILLTSLISSQTKTTETFWKRLNAPHSGNILALASSPEKDTTKQIVATTTNGKLCRSLDFGITWEEVAPTFSFNSASAFSIGTNGHYYGGMLNGGMYYSTDNGDNWIQPLKLPYFPVKAILSDVDNKILVATTHGLYYSTDYGESWDTSSLAYDKINTLSSFDLNKASKIAFAGMENKGVFITNNGGIDWSPSSLTGISVYSMSINRQNSVFVSSDSGRIYASSDTGKSWVKLQISDIYRKVTALCSAPDGRLFAGTDSAGIYVSKDEGISWNTFYTGITNPCITNLLIALKGDNKFNIIAGTQDGGIFCIDRDSSSWRSTGLPVIAINDIKIYKAQDSTETVIASTDGSGVYISKNNGSDWLQINNGLTELKVNNIAVNSSGDLYAITNPSGSTPGSTNGLFRLSSGEKSWQNIIPSGKFALTALSINKNDEIFLASYKSKLYRSKDKGSTWQIIDLSKFNTAINCFAFSDSGRIFAGTSSSGVLYSDDNGSSWVQSGLMSTPGILTIGIDSKGRIFAGGYSGDIYKSGPYRSTDNGITWTTFDWRITLYSIVFNKECDIFAATAGEGAAVSKDNGASRTFAYEGMGELLLTSLAISSKGQLYAGTFDNGIYISKSTVTSVQDIADAVSLKYNLSQNFPNPFNPETAITFSLPVSQNIKLSVYNIIGKEVAILKSEYTPAGTHTVRFNASGLPSGVYIYTLQAGSFRDSKKLLLLK